MIIMKLYHYTNLASAIGIIQPKRKLCFWGSRYDCMNDPFDFQFSNNRFLPPTIEAAKEIGMQDSEIEEVMVHPFIVSFSRHADDFLMWRLYNAKICLVLESEYFDRNTPNVALIECEYINDTAKERQDAFTAIDKKIDYCRNVYANVGRISTFIKNSAFQVEGEVRLATWDYYNSHGDTLCLPDCKDSNPIVEKNFYSRMNTNGYITLYKKFNIDGNALDGIIVHSYSEIEFEPIKNALRSILIQNGFSHDVFSNIKPTSVYPFNLH